MENKNIDYFPQNEKREIREEEISFDTRKIRTIITEPENEQTLEYLNYQERLRTKMFRYCEQGNLKKLKILLDKNQPNDSIPDVNSKFLHNYTVLHIAVANST
jgi:hypothetical protein